MVPCILVTTAEIVRVPTFNPTAHRASGTKSNNVGLLPPVDGPVPTSLTRPSAIKASVNLETTATLSPPMRPRSDLDKGARVRISSSTSARSWARLSSTPCAPGDEPSPAKADKIHPFPTTFFLTPLKLPRSIRIPGAMSSIQAFVSPTFICVVKMSCFDTWVSLDGCRASTVSSVAHIYPPTQDIGFAHPITGPRAPYLTHGSIQPCLSSPFDSIP